jgi:hypothetical protein
MRILLIMVTALALLAGAGCRDGAPNLGGETESAGEPASLPGNLPATWTTGPPTKTRKESHMVRDDGGAVADISLVILPGSTGPLRDTVNQWRAQLDAPPLDQAGYNKIARILPTAAGEAVVVDLIGIVDGADSSFDGRIVAAVVARSQETWIFKMRGNAALVGAHKQAFLDWAAGVEPDDAPPPDPPPFPAPALQPSPGREPAWQLPAGWLAVPATPPHFACFSIPHSGNATGRISVILLAGDGGGPLANVNRYRSKLGLPPVSQQDLATATQTLWCGDTEMTLIDLTESRRCTIAAWTTRKDGTWLFELTAPEQAAAAQRPAFARFLASLRFAGD